MSTRAMPKPALTFKPSHDAADLRAAEVKNRIAVLKATITGTIERPENPFADSADLLLRATGYSSSALPALAAKHGEEEALAMLCMSIIKSLAFDAQEGSAKHFRALATIAGDAAQKLECAREEQPGLASAESEHMQAWPLFYCPDVGKDHDALAEITRSLRLRKERNLQGGFRPHGTEFQSAAEIIGNLATCLVLAIERAQQFKVLGIFPDIIKSAPWAERAGRLPATLSKAPDAARRVAVEAMVWALGPHPEESPRFAAVVAHRRGSVKFGTDSSQFKALLYRAFDKRIRASGGKKRARK